MYCSDDVTTCTALLCIQGLDAACERNHLVVGAMCRNAETQALYSPSRQHQTLKDGYDCTTKGLVCLNSANRYFVPAHTQCFDYEVMYACAGNIPVPD